MNYFLFETIEDIDIPASPKKSTMMDEKDLEDLFDGNLEDIKLHVEDIGLIEEDKKELTLDDMYIDELSFTEAGLYDVTVDSNLGDIGLLKDIHLYSYDYKLPYSFNLAKYSCKDIKRVCELIVSINTPRTLRPREFIKYKMLSWYLIRYGDDLYEQTLGDVIKDKLSICKIRTDIEETVNGYICKSLDGLVCELYKTNLFEIKELIETKDERKQQNIRKLLWDGETYKEYWKSYNEKNEKPNYVNLYKKK